MWGIEENVILGGGAAQLALLGEHAPDTCGSRGRCDNPPRKIPYYRLNKSTLVIKR
jgi:hypothetical protein